MTEKNCCLRKCARAKPVGFHRSSRFSGRVSTRSISSPSNPHTEQSEVLASSVEWLQYRVEHILASEGPQPRSSAASILPEIRARSQFLAEPPADFSVFRRTIVYTQTVGASASSRLSARQDNSAGVIRERRQRSQELLFRLLKRLQSVSRNLASGACLVSDDDFCRLLPLAICASYHDMQPASESMLARTLANMSCHKAFYSFTAPNNFICNLIESWSNSPSLLLSLCGRKIAANLSTYSLMATLNPSITYRPFCVFQPDLYELARPILVVPFMDVIFINGMLGSVFFTWKQSGDECSTECWPRDWLAQDLPRARILALNMKITVIKWRGCSAVDTDPSGCLPRRANEALLQLLAAGVGSRLTAFVCHSFGGLILKQLLQLLHATRDDPVRKRLLDSVLGIAFVAVPHLGRSQAVNVNRCYWRPLRRMCLTEEAKQVFDGSCRVLSRLHAWFVSYARTRPDMRVLNMIEQHRTTLGPIGFGLKVCPETLADKLVGDIVRIPLDHILICKPPSRAHEAYTVLLRFLVNLAQVSANWRPALIGGSGLHAPEWRRPLRNCEEELRLRYGVSVSRALMTSSAWETVRAEIRSKFYDLL